MPESNSRSPLERRLDETPIPDDALWRLYWDQTPDGKPEILARLARTLTAENRGAHVLIAGRYGCGKTSLLDALRAHLRTCTSPPPLTIVLNMPLITAHTGTSPVAAVIGAMVEHLCGTPPPVFEDWSEDWLAWQKGHSPDDGLCGNLWHALDDLLLREADCHHDCEPRSEQEAPRPNRLVGAPTQISTRVYRTNVIEQYIDARLGYASGAPQRRRLIVFLDDVDRCHRHVPAAIIRLLLRFGTTKGVRFVVASDRELMARGVEEWMQANGTDAGGQVYVTANSALEKYLGLIVDVPSLEDEAQPGIEAPELVLSDPPLKLLLEKVQFDQPDRKGGQQPILRTRSGMDRPALLAEYLLTWMLSEVEERDLLRPAYVPSPPPSAPPSAPEGPSAAPPKGPATPTSTDPPPGIGFPTVPPGFTLEDAQGLSNSPRTSNLNQAPLSQESASKEPSPPGYIKKANSFAEGLRELVDLDTGMKVLRLRPRYAGLIRSLTPRQLKFYLRALLSGTVRSGRLPAVTLLKQVFFGFYRLRTDEPHLFRFAAASAATALEAVVEQTAAGHLAGSDRVREGSRELSLCFEQVRAIAEASTVLRGEALRQAWPVQREEQVLLVRLLAVVRDEDSAPEAGRDARDDGRDDGSRSIEGGPDREFAEWAKERLGKEPAGMLVADQVSSFQDEALEAERREVPGIAGVVAEYADRFLVRQARYFAQRTSASLSNLAVMIDDVEPYEAQCDRLFAAAVRLDPRHGTIPLNHADFLATVAAVPSRFARLIPSPYANRDALLQRAEDLVATATAPDADPKSRLYGETIRLRIAKARNQPQAELVDHVEKLVERQMGLFASAARGGDSEPVVRLDAAMDAVLGSTGADLPRKGPIFGLIWGVLERCGLPVWTATQSLANNLVGQSLNGSAEELLGARMNLALLTDPHLITNRADQIAPVWTQTLSVWARRFAGTQSAAVRKRAALGLLAARAYGGGRNWDGRARTIWGTCGGTGNADPATLEAALDPALSGLLNDLRAHRDQPQAAVDAVFGTDFGEPMRRVEHLAVAQNWSNWPSLKARIEDLARRTCPGTGAATLPPPGGGPDALTSETHSAMPTAAAPGDDAASALLMYDRASPPQPERKRIFEVTAESAKGAPASTQGSATPKQSFAGGFDQEFADWVKAHFGNTPAGDLVADQVAAFQEEVLAAGQRGEPGIDRIVAEYVDRFLTRHGRYLAQRTAASLSNLAVMIDDAEGRETQCDRLFAEAVRLNPEQGSIPLYYAEFLAKVAGIPGRLGQLVPEPYKDREDLLQRADSLVDTRTSTDEKSGFYAATLKLLIQKARGLGMDDLALSLAQLVRERIGLFVESARRGDPEPITRLDATMDTVLAGGPAVLARKARVLGLVWGVLQRCGLPTWTPAQVLANDLVGETGSPEKTHGVRINLWLLANADAAAGQAHPVASIWTQTLAVWSERTPEGGSEALRGRAALGLLAALVYGGGLGWKARANAVWRRLGGTGEFDPQARWEAVPTDQQALLRGLEEVPPRAQALVDAVFGDDLGAPIDSVDALAAAAQWPQWPDLAPEIAKLAAQHCPDSGGNAHD